MPLPALVAAAPALISGASTAYSLFSKAKNKPPVQDYGQQIGRLKDVAQRGYYTPEVRSRVLGNTARTLGAFAQRNKASTRGELARIGADKSIAGVKALGQADRTFAQGVQEEGGRMSLEDAAIKNRARDQIASLMDAAKYNREAAKYGQGQDIANTFSQGFQQFGTVGMQGLQKDSMRKALAKFVEDSEADIASMTGDEARDFFDKLIAFSSSRGL